MLLIIGAMQRDVRPAVCLIVVDARNTSRGQVPDAERGAPGQIAGR